MKLTKKFIYIGLFSILYFIVAFSSFWHACAFFGLANNSWMSIILAFAFEIGQAAVLFSLLTSEKHRSRIMPWVLMTMFTIVQVIGNVFSSYKYIMNNSVEDLRYFKEPIFIWTSLPDEQATVIITYIVGAILPVCALFLTSMITNYLTDEAAKQNLTDEAAKQNLTDEAAKQNLTDEEQKLKENKIIIELPTDENGQIIGTDTGPGGSIKGPQGPQGYQGKIENEESIIVPEPSQKGPNPPIIINSPEDLDKIYKEEYEDKEQATDETKNIGGEPIKTENNDEIDEEISEELDVPKIKEKSHFINL